MSVDRDFTHESAEIYQKATKISTATIDQVRREDPQHHSTLAMVLIGILFGTAYSAELARAGDDSAYNWAVRVLQVAEDVARHFGGEIGFTVVRKEKNS